MRQATRHHGTRRIAVAVTALLVLGACSDESAAPADSNTDTRPADSTVDTTANGADTTVDRPLDTNDTNGTESSSAATAGSSTPDDSSIPSGPADTDGPADAAAASDAASADATATPAVASAATTTATPTAAAATTAGAPVPTGASTTTAAPTTTTAAATTTTGASAVATTPAEPLPPVVDVDGVLTIGVLLPQTGPNASTGLVGINAATIAVNAVNAAGGFRDEPVQMIIRDEGETLSDAQASLDELLDAGVDAVVGPGSSTITLELLDELMDAQVLTCSPTANTLLLDTFPNRDLFFRVVPSDSHAADAMANRVTTSGFTRTALVYLDDGFGRPFADAARDALAAEGFDRPAPTLNHYDTLLEA